MPFQPIVFSILKQLLAYGRRMAGLLDLHTASQEETASLLVEEQIVGTILGSGKLVPGQHIFYLSI